MSESLQSDPNRRNREGFFIPETLDEMVIAIPPLRQLLAEEEDGQPSESHNVVLDPDFEFRNGRVAVILSHYRRFIRAVDELPRRSARLRSSLASMPALDLYVGYSDES
jgi:hypothetical protein